MCSVPRRREWSAEPRMTAISPSTFPSTLAEPATTTRSPVTWPLIVAFPDTITASSTISPSFKTKSFPTMTTGWHYFVDVLGGIVLAVISIVFAKRLTSRMDTRRR